MKSTLLLSSLVILMTAAISRADKQTYTMADLKSLAQNKSWSELYAHLGDIAPSARNAEWNDLAEQTAVGALDHFSDTQSPLEGISASEAIISKYPQVKASSSFMKKRGDLGLSAFGKCYQVDGLEADCGTELQKFIAEDPTNLDLAFKAGKLSRLHQNAWFSIYFFGPALKTPSPTRKCDDEDVKLALNSAFALPPTDHPDAIQSAVGIATGACWSTLKPFLVSSFRGGDTYFHQNTCGFMKEKGALSKLQLSSCDKK